MRRGSAISIRVKASRSICTSPIAVKSARTAAATPRWRGATMSSPAIAAPSSAKSRSWLVLSKERPAVARLHWGGGTPSILGLDGLQSVVAALRRHFPFDAGFEHAIELDPRYVTAGLAEGLAELGITRASLGIQDINPLVQAAIGRLQPLVRVEAAVKRLRRAGIGNLSFDLMYGLPLQTLESIRKTCASVAALSPDRIACFGYAHLPRLKANQRRIDEARASLPGPAHRSGRSDRKRACASWLCEDRHRSFCEARRRAALSQRRPASCIAISRVIPMTIAGFCWDWAPPRSRPSRTALSRISRTFRDMSGPSTSGSLATVRGCRRDAGDRHRAAIIEALMCHFEVDLEFHRAGSRF